MTAYLIHSLVSKTSMNRFTSASRPKIRGKSLSQIFKSTHSNIVGYHGYSVIRGRIMTILLKRLDQTLTQYVSTLDFQQLDKIMFCEALESAVDYLHSLG
jgi:hypothetical protein